jgi:polysaccharide pyruvyl transferase WcaK-like protein
MNLSPSVNIICTTPTVLKTGPAAQTSSTMVIDPINHLGKEEEERIGLLNGQVKQIKDELK